MNRERIYQSIIAIQAAIICALVYLLGGKIAFRTIVIAILTIAVIFEILSTYAFWKNMKFLKKIEEFQKKNGEKDDKTLGEER